jgi:hypothetical protein
LRDPGEQIALPPGELVMRIAPPARDAKHL